METVRAEEFIVFLHKVLGIEISVTVAAAEAVPMVRFPATAAHWVLKNKNPGF